LGLSDTIRTHPSNHHAMPSECTQKWGLDLERSALDLLGEVVRVLNSPAVEVIG
jgi:hypothetical protein